jgi:hypothetical protein
MDTNNDWFLILDRHGTKGAHSFQTFKSKIQVGLWSNPTLVSIRHYSQEKPLCYTNQGRSVAVIQTASIS